MNTPIHDILRHCETGFTLTHKALIVCGCLLYVICPLDLDFVPIAGWLDDGFALFLAIRVLMSPTLTHTTQSASHAARWAKGATSTVHKQPDQTQRILKGEVSR